MKKCLLIASILLTGCTHSIHMSHMSDFASNAPAAKQFESKVINIETEQFVFMGFVFDTDYVDQAYQQLLDQCAGEVSAVNTQYSTSHGFLHWKNKIRMRAVCKS